MRLKIAQVIGLNTDQKAAQVSFSQREELAFIAVLELVSDDAFTKGRQILSELEDFYFDSEGSISEKLTATFTEAGGKFPEGSEFSLALSAVSGKVLYIIGKGQVEAYLKRADKLLPLLSVGAPSELISGFVDSGDRLLFATKSLVSFLGSDLEKSLSLPTETFEEELEGKIGVSESENKGLAALAVEVIEEDLEISPVPEQDTDQLVKQETDNSLPQPRFHLPSIKPVLTRILGVVKALPNYFPKTGRARLILAVVLIIVVSLGAGYKYKLSKDKAKEQQFNQMLQSATDDFNAAKGLASLNPIETKNKLEAAKDKVSKALGLKPADERAQGLKKQIEEESSSILKQSTVSDFPVFLDMDLVKKNFQATQMSLSKDKLLLLDPGTKTLVVMDLTKKSNQILAGSTTLGDAAVASLNGGAAFVYSDTKGVLKVETSSQKLTTVAKKSSNLGKVQDIYGFAGNVYLLDEGQIWKYLPTTDGYSDAREYLSKSVKADFSNVVRMQIESSVYVLKKGGEILRFTKGDKDNFSLEGLPSAVKDPKSIFVSSDTENLYLLDSGNSRLLTLTKTGSYKSQITGNKFATATDLAVDEIGKKVYLLEGGKIYSVDLK